MSYEPEESKQEPKFPEYKHLTVTVLKPIKFCWVYEAVPPDNKESGVEEVAITKLIILPNEHNPLEYPNKLN